jgi:hypothetical protein
VLSTKQTGENRLSGRCLLTLPLFTGVESGPRWAQALPHLGGRLRVQSRGNVNAGSARNVLATFRTQEEASSRCRQSLSPSSAYGIDTHALDQGWSFRLETPRNLPGGGV